MTLMHWLLLRTGKEYSTLHEKMKRLNVGGLVNYMYNNKYLAEVSVNHIGVGSFAPGKDLVLSQLLVPAG